MARGNVQFLAANRGEVSNTALARLDIEKLRLAAEQQINWMPLAMGPMTLRPGLQYLGSTASDAAAKLLEFVFSADDTSLIELTDNKLRVWTSDALVTRVSVASTLQAYGSWTAVEAPSATVTVAAGPSITIENVARGNVSSARGTLTISNDDKVKEHALRVVVSKGPVLFKVGSAADTDDIFSETSLAEGTHSLAFTPNVNTAYVQVSTASVWASRVVDSITVESAGTLELTTPWNDTDLSGISYAQSADVIFLAHSSYVQYRIERHREGGSNNSWSLVKYYSDDGPFPAAAGDDSIKLSPSAVNGDVTLTANKPVFHSTHVGALIRLFHETQNVTETLEAEDTWTDPIRVSGVATYTSGATTVNSDERKFQVDISGTWAGTITLQRTFDPEGKSDWVDYATYTTNQTATIINDQFYNVIVWYRLGFKPYLAVTSPGTWVWNGYTWVYTGSVTTATGYTSGTAVCTLTYSGGGGSGIGRIYEYTSTTEVEVEVLTPFKNAGKASNWRISDWNGENDFGFPSAVEIHEGRLWWAGGGQIWGSKSDDYSSFEFEAIGDDAPIQRSIGKGPVANIHWLCSLSRLALGTDSGIVTARSNSFDEPLTPTVFNLKSSMTQGATALRPVIVDTKAMFVERSGRRVYGMLFSSEAFDYKPLDLTRLNLDIGLEGFTDISVQRQPDTHIRLPRGDGMMANFLYDEDDELSAWWRIQTDGEIENVAVLPGDLEDRVYVVVKRTINGNTKRYLEKFARLDECQGGTISKLADSFIQWAGGSTTTVTGLSHLEGESVVVWYNGLEVGFDASSPQTIATYTVTGGQITVPTAVNAGAIIGLPYTATYVSTKLAYAVEGGAALNKRKKVNALGFSLVNTHFQGVRYGSYREDYSEQTLRSLPRVEFGEVTPTGKIWSSFEQDMMDFPGEINTDTRIVIEGRAPRPATVLGFSADITVAD
jgi:hypothetical protein